MIQDPWFWSTVVLALGFLHQTFHRSRAEAEALEWEAKCFKLAQMLTPGWKP